MAPLPAPRLHGLRALLVAFALVTGPVGAVAEPPTSVANHLLFETDQLSGVTPPADLRYAFQHRGAGEEPYADAIVLHVGPGEASGKRVEVDYFSGERRRYVPPVEGATGNPVVMVFLQRDVSEMQRLTKGSWRYFQRAIKFALADTAEVRPVTFHFDGREVHGTEVRFQPYRRLADREALKALAEKTYSITLSDAVPGGVYELRTVVPGAAPGAPAVLEETLTYHDS